MAFLRRFWAGRKKARPKRPEKKKEVQKPVEAKPEVSKLRLLAEGALDYPTFVEACEKMGARGNEQILGLFEQLYKWYSQYPALGSLEAQVELEAKVESLAFEEAVFWADVMMANKLMPGKKIRIPAQYAETYRRLAGKKK